MIGDCCCNPVNPVDCELWSDQFTGLVGSWTINNNIPSNGLWQVVSGTVTASANSITLISGAKIKSLFDYSVIEENRTLRLSIIATFANLGDGIKIGMVLDHVIIIKSKEVDGINKWMIYIDDVPQGTLPNFQNVWFANTTLLIVLCISTHGIVLEIPLLGVVTLLQSSGLSNSIDVTLQSIGSINIDAVTANNTDVDANCEGCDYQFPYDCFYCLERPWPRAIIKMPSFQTTADGVYSRFGLLYADYTWCKGATDNNPFPSGGCSELQGQYRLFPDSSAGILTEDNFCRLRIDMVPVCRQFKDETYRKMTRDEQYPSDVPDALGLPPFWQEYPASSIVVEIGPVPASGYLGWKSTYTNHITNTQGAGDYPLGFGVDIQFGDSNQYTGKQFYLSSNWGITTALIPLTKDGSLLGPLNPGDPSESNRVNCVGAIGTAPIEDYRTTFAKQTVFGLNVVPVFTHHCKTTGFVEIELV